MPRMVRSIAATAAAVVAVAVAAIAAAAVAGCGGGSAVTVHPLGSSGFAWLQARPTPPRWKVATTPSGAKLAYPAAWRPIETDPGTASAAPRVAGGPFVGYLNATPQGGDETVANWSRFRVAHVAAEGAHDVRLATAATGLHFGAGRASCVVDSYSTWRTRFREIACIVEGRRTTVVVAAAPVRRWATEAPVLRRAVASFRP
jgi:hypothetical protein